MRFPWLQVDSDFIAARAADLGAHLGISRREAIGLAVDLWTWALTRAPDSAPPDGLIAGTGPVPDRLLAGSVGWTGPVEPLVDGLLAVGLLVRIECGYRISGIGRYRATWEKNRRRAGPVPDRNRDGTVGGSSRKTQTQTQTQKKQLPPPAGAAGTGQEDSAKLELFADGLAIDPSGPAGELDLDLQIAPGAAVAAKAVKPRGKNADASGEATSAFQALKLAMVAVYEARRRRKYRWHRRDPRGVQDCLELERVYGREELLRHWARGLDRAGEKFATGQEKISYIWELPDAWGPIDGLLAAEGVAGPVEPAAPQEPAWMDGEVGERWRQARDESGTSYTFDQAARLLVGAEQDVDVLRLVTADSYGANWIRGNCLDLLRAWFGDVTIEAQPGGAA